MLLSSPLIGPHGGNMQSVARNISVLVGAELLPPSANGTQQLQLTVQELQLSIDLSPKNTPGEVVPFQLDELARACMNTWVCVHASDRAGCYARMLACCPQSPLAEAFVTG